MSSLKDVTRECSTFTVARNDCAIEDLKTCFDMSQEVKCVDHHGYIFDMSADDAFWSLASEYEWVCEKSEYGSSILVAQSIGIIVSTVIFMQLSDR